MVVTTLLSDDEDMPGNSGEEGSTMETELATTFVPNFTTDMIDISTDSNSTLGTSITILAAVAVVAILTLIIFAIVTFRYLFVHKGSYRVHEFSDVIKGKSTGKDVKLNIYELQASKEWLL